MAIAVTLREYLDTRAINYDVLKHQPTHTASHTAETSHVPGDRLAKAVVLKGAAGFLVAVVPASYYVRLDEVSELLERTLDFATEDEFQPLFADCERGAIPALASAYGLETVIDERMDQPQDIYLEAGDHQSLIHLSQQEFRELTWDAFHGRFAKHM